MVPGYTRMLSAWCIDSHAVIKLVDVCATDPRWPWQHLDIGFNPLVRGQGAELLPSRWAVFFYCICPSCPLPLLPLLPSHATCYSIISSPFIICHFHPSCRLPHCLLIALLSTLWKYQAHVSLLWQDSGDFFSSLCRLLPPCLCLTLVHMEVVRPSPLLMPPLLMPQ